MPKSKKNIINKLNEKEAWSIILFIFSIIIFFSIIGFDFTSPEYPESADENSNYLLGKFGAYVSFYLITKTIGVFAIVIPLILLAIAYAMFFKKNILKYLIKSSYLLLLAVFCATLFDKILELFFINLHLRSLSGAIPIMINNAVYGTTNHQGLIGPVGFWLLIPTIIIILISFLFEISLYDLLIKIIEKVNRIIKMLISFGKLFFEKIKLILDNINHRLKFKSKSNIEISKPIETSEESVLENEIDNNLIDEESKKDVVELKEVDSIDKANMKRIDIEYSDEMDDAGEIEIEDEVEIEQGDLDKHESRKAKYKKYKLPLTENLINPIEIDKDDDAALTNKARELQHALETFGVKSEVKRITQGPVITMFEIEPNEGVRVNKFTNLSDDLARVMAAQRIRVIAPIPGTKSIGIELPNENPSIVYLKTIINSEQYINSKSKLTIGLGKTTIGDAYTFDLAKMPHLLVAGATGAGKSVCINTIIVSILYKAKPDEVKFIMIDPKKLELATYKSLVGYHLITAPNLDEYVMTTAENAVGILNSAIDEMERRFQVFSDARVRNIAEYHDRCEANEELENIPYIVVLIDELADLMMTSGRAVEEPITRLAQKARAVGIHLVVATQRPSVDVITGLIKSNFPARISFQVSSKIDSRTILDQMGAEKLLGRGDMLFLLPGSASPIRLHNAFIELGEIEKIMNHITDQPKPDEIHLPEINKVSSDGDFSVDDGSGDELLYEAAKIVIDNQQASVSLLQRKLRVGYSRAGRLIDELESLGIISEHNGSKPRDVLVDDRYIDNIFNK